MIRVRYEVSYGTAMGGYSSDNQKEVYELAKKMAKTDATGAVFMRRIVWDCGRISSMNTVLVNADGSFTKVN